MTVIICDNNINNNNKIQSIIWYSYIRLYTHSFVGWSTTAPLMSLDFARPRRAQTQGPGGFWEASCCRVRKSGIPRDTMGTLRNRWSVIDSIIFRYFELLAAFFLGHPTGLLFSCQPGTKKKPEVSAKFGAGKMQHLERLWKTCRWRARGGGSASVASVASNVHRWLDRWIVKHRKGHRCRSPETA